MQYNKSDFEKIRQQIISMERVLGEMEQNCDHDYYQHKNSMVCSICGHIAGWICNNSPDLVCHYFSVKKRKKTLC